MLHPFLIEGWRPMALYKIYSIPKLGPDRVRLVFLALAEVQMRVLISTLGIFVMAMTVPLQVTVMKTFPGMSGPNPPTAGSTSADMMGGVSPRHLIGFTNRGFSVQ